MTKKKALSLNDKLDQILISTKICEIFGPLNFGGIKWWLKKKLV